MLTNQSDFKIPMDKRQSWVSLASIWVGNMICIPALMVGGFLSVGFSMNMVIITLIIGFIIICVYMSLIGMQAADTGLPSVAIAGEALGTLGSRFIISLLLGIACIGWFGVQVAVCGNSFSVMFNDITGIFIPPWISTSFWGIIMVLTAIYGYKSLKYFSYVVVPLLVIMLIYTAYASLFKGDGLVTIMAYKSQTPMDFVTGISIVVGSFALGGVISGDYSRYARKRSDVIKSSIIGVFPISLIIMGLGAASSITSGYSDITEILVYLGFPSFALAILILATWSTNILNAYSGGIAISNMLGLSEVKLKITTAIAGILGTILGAIGIVSKFTTFLSILSSLIPPVAGVIIASYWIINRGRVENFKIVEGVNITGVISFVIAAAVAYTTANIIPFFISPLNGIVVAMVLYIILIKILPVKEKEISYEKNRM